MIDTSAFTPIRVAVGPDTATITYSGQWASESAALLRAVSEWTVERWERESERMLPVLPYYWCAIRAARAVGGTVTDAPDAALPRVNAAQIV